MQNHELFLYVFKTFGFLFVIASWVFTCYAFYRIGHSKGVYDNMVENHDNINYVIEQRDKAKQMLEKALSLIDKENK